MNEPEELVKLRSQVEQLLADALSSTERHDAEQARRVAEAEQRDELHQLELVRNVEAHEHEMSGLRTALENRDTIGQAKGIVMATIGCSADEAFALLRSQSQHENRKLVDVAIDLVDHTARRPRT